MINLLGSSEDRQSLGQKFRDKRNVFFKSLIKELPTPIKILDVGGREYYWENAGLAGNSDYEFVLLNLNQIETTYSNMKSVAGDATDMKEYKDKEFDIVFSNSVIEHLYTAENQIKMANEMMRVGKKYFVQTPNKHFFIEPHYLLPYFQYLPQRLKYFLLTKTKLSRGHKWDRKFAQQYIDEIRLLSLNEFKALFQGSSVYREKFLGLSKSFILHNFL